MPKQRISKPSTVTVELAQIPPLDPMADMSHEEFMSELEKLEQLLDGDAAAVQEAR